MKEPLTRRSLRQRVGKITRPPCHPIRRFTYAVPSIPCRAMRDSSAPIRRIAVTSWLRSPCFHMPLRGPEGAPPPAPCIRQTVQPLTAGAWHGLPDRFDVARHRCASCRRCDGCMGLSLFLVTIPPSDCSNFQAPRHRQPQSSRHTKGVQTWPKTRLLMVCPMPLLTPTALPRWASLQRHSRQLAQW